MRLMRHAFQADHSKTLHEPLSDVKAKAGSACRKALPSWAVLFQVCSSRAGEAVYVAWIGATFLDSDAASAAGACISRGTRTMEPP